MTRKLILTLAAAATVAAATFTLGSSAVYARGFGGGGGGGMSRGGAHVSMGGGQARMAIVHNSSRVRLPSRPGRIGRPGRPILIPIGRLQPPPIGRLQPPHHHHHHHWVFRGGRWIVLDEVVVGGEASVAAPAVPGPCTCLTKTYTPTGLVVFADVCTRESASAPAQDDTADASQAPTTNVPARATPISEVPTKPNYAGRTYDDYLAANPQAKPQASTLDPQAN